MGASGVEWFVDGSRDNPSVVSAVRHSVPCAASGHCGRGRHCCNDPLSPSDRTRTPWALSRREAERLGGERQIGPERAPTGLVAGYFADPRANLIGVAGPA